MTPLVGTRPLRLALGVAPAPVYRRRLARSLRYLSTPVRQMAVRY